MAFPAGVWSRPGGEVSVGMSQKASGASGAGEGGQMRSGLKRAFDGNVSGAAFSRSKFISQKEDRLRHSDTAGRQMLLLRTNYESYG